MANKLNLDVSVVPLIKEKLLNHYHFIFDVDSSISPDNVNKGISLNAFIWPVIINASDVSSSFDLKKVVSFPLSDSIKKDVLDYFENNNFLYHL